MRCTVSRTFEVDPPSGVDMMSFVGLPPNPRPHRTDTSSRDLGCVRLSSNYDLTPLSHAASAGPLVGATDLQCGAELVGYAEDLRGLPLVS